MTCHSNFFVLGSSSAGNSYIFELSGTKVLIEAGFKASEINRRAVLVGTDLIDLKAVLVTHEHIDHAIGIKGEDHYFSRRRIPIYASKGTLEACGDPITGVPLKAMTPSFIGTDILVLPFAVKHDAAEPLGFVINDFRGGKRILFINDCSAIRADLSSIPFDIIFIECNYFDQALHIEMHKAEEEGKMMLVKRYMRIHDCHLGLSGTRKILNTLDLSKCKAVFLMHLSDQNSRENEMLNTIRLDHPGLQVYACRKEGGIETCRG